jgi:hypothetical protein
MRSRWHIALVMVAVVAMGGRADAEPTKAEVARQHFEAGRALYHTGNYEEAMHEFALGYDLVDKPEFILNIGLCHYRMGRLAKARENFRRFIDMVPADNPSRAYAQEQLAEVEQAIAAQPTAEPPPQKPDEPVIAAPPAATVTTPAPPRRSWIRRNWWIVPVAVVVAGGVAVGLGVGLTRNNACAGAGACIAVPAN